MKQVLSIIVLLFTLSITNSFALSEQAGCEYNGVNYKNAKSFVHDLKIALKSANKNAVADMISYPLRVNTTSPETHKYITRYIKTKKAFIDDYDEFFTEEKVNAIIDDQGIFCNYQGAMLADGFIWFEADKNSARIFAINQ